MRTLPPEVEAALASGATSFATCWRIARKDGVVLGFTDHDERLSFGGLDYVPAHGLDGTERPARLGAAIDTAEALGILSSEAIAADDLQLGRYDGAEVTVFRVDWREPSRRFTVLVAQIGEVLREDGLFRAELRSAQAALNVAHGRLYQALCDAELGDARCGVDLAAPAYRAEAVVLGARDRFRLAVSGTGSFAAGWFAAGIARWQSGKRTGLVERVLTSEREGGIDIMGFAAPVGDWVAAGDALILTAGCDRRFATCRARFDNGANFRGFPHVPGTDFVLRYPTPGARLDGRALVE